MFQCKCQHVHERVSFLLPHVLVLCFVFLFFCKIPKCEVELYGSHMDKAWEIQVVMVTHLIPLAPRQV